MPRRITGQLVIATHNPGKLAEMRELLSPYGVTAISASELGLAEPEETGDSFAANAQDQGGRGRDGRETSGVCRRFRSCGRSARRRARNLFGALGRTVQGFQRRDEPDRAAAGERGATEPGQTKSAFRLRAVRRLARRPSRGSRGTRRRHAGLAAARHGRLRLRSDVPARRPRPHLRRDELDRKARPAAARPRACRTAPAPSSNWRSAALIRPAPYAPPQAGEGRTAFGVYVHWPFCLSKCPYCDFNSHVRHAAIDEDRFARAFAREIETTAARAPGREVSSIFFGGGTPSLMQPETVGRDPRRHRQALARRRRRRSDAGGQSHQRRGDAFRRLSRSRRQPRLARRAGAGRCVAERCSAGCIARARRWPRSRSRAARSSAIRST